MKKIVSIILILTFVLIPVGCSEQSNPEDTVDNYFKAVQKFDLETMNSLMAEPEEDNFEEMLDEEGDMASYFMDYIKDNAKEIEYEITNTETEEDTAKVYVKTKFVNGSPLILKTFGELFTNLMAEAFSGNEMSDEEIEKMIVQIMEEKSQEIEIEFVESEVTVDLVKKDGNWYIEEVTDELANVITANFVKALEEIGESFN
jgi:hypothetical protein